MLPRAQTLSGLAVLYLFIGLTSGIIWPPLMKRWQYNRKILLLFPLGAALLMGFFARSQTLFHYILWTVPAGTIVGVAYTNSMFHTLSGTAERQKRMNIHEIILTAASLTGSLGGGFLLDRYSMDRIILLSALLMLAVFLLQLGVDFSM